jgi:hypothetical protein
MPEAAPVAPQPTRRKPSFPIREELRDYLRRYRRERELPVTYARLRAFHEVIPLVDEQGQPTLWDTVIYDPGEMAALNEGLKEVYAALKVDGDLSVVRHLYVDRVDFCTFGNSTPFRIRIVNAYNDNQDYFYVKKADSSRIYGLELIRPERIDLVTGVNERGSGTVSSDMRLLVEKDFDWGTLIFEQNLYRTSDTYLGFEKRLARKLYTRAYWAREQVGRRLNIGGAYGAELNLRWELD